MSRFTVLLIAMMFAASICSQSAVGGEVDSVQAALDRAVVDARLSLDKFGESDSAMHAIELILSKVAVLPGLKDRAVMKELHGGKNMKRALLASEKDSGICLYLSWFGKGAATPVHNHLTWGVLRVLEGRDNHCRWRRREVSGANSAAVEKTEEKVLGAGQSTYWLGPPADMHTQATMGDADVWELVMVGHDLAADYVARNQSRFDPATGLPILKEQKK